MQTRFSPAQLADPANASSERILRSCVHCGFCTATCPTYVLDGNELDSPRGRIVLIKDMLENDRPADHTTVKHIDRCLSCLSCMSTCPSGVNYMHLVDHARAHIERTYRRPLLDRLQRRALALVLPHSGRFRLLMRAAAAAKPLGRRLPDRVVPARLRTMLDLAPARVPRASPTDRPRTYPAQGARVRRVALLTGCAQKALAPAINESTIRLLTRHGCEVVVSRGAGCCGALTHHLGHDAHGYAADNIRAWTAEADGAGLDAIVTNASGCGTAIKDYGFLFRTHPTLAADAVRVSALARDVTELVAELGLRPATVATGQRVAYHAACSLQHGQRVRLQPRQLLQAAGFAVLDIPEGHLCCGSAGTYNILQPAIATRLRDRKLAAIDRTRPDLVAAGNIGCITQIATAAAVPVVHTVELLDWATGGPKPAALPAMRVDAGVPSV